MNQSVKKIDKNQDLNDLILNEDQLNKMASNSRLFEVKFQNEIKGIALDKDLKNFFNDVQENANEFKFYTVREIYLNQEGEILANQDFISVLKHPYFQRRRPQVQGELQIDPETQIWLVEHGHKTGPFKMEELQQKLDEKVLKLGDLVSIDEGHTWGKIYQLKGFDRRQMSATKLPQGPNSVVLNEAQSTADKHLRYNIGKKGELDAIASLSFLGQVRNVHNKNIWDEKVSDGAAGDKSSTEIFDTDHSPNQQKLTLFKISLMLIIFLALLTVTWNFVTNDNDQNTTDNLRPMGRLRLFNRQKTPPKEVTPPVPSNTETKTMPAKMGERKSSSTGPIPSSKLTNKAGEEASENIPDENFYYDDGNTPYEQDAVRKKLGRELINPQVSPFDGRKKNAKEDNAEGLFGNGRGPAPGSEEGLFEQEAEL